uniref:Uncharacterized protein n=1 Tax=Globisporangium ultimum (strain ATCC 200006 / CBS 805.95 / DAOM BR144) TaxID=431595 RepID=K3X4R0_GLOUD
MNIPVYTSFYLLNLTNAEDVLSGEAQPQLQQVGPITYEKRSRKINVQFEAVPFQPTSLPYGYVRYQVLSSYYFVPERSNGTESDRIVTVNATYARRLQKLRSRGYSERLMLAEFAQQHVQEYTRHLQQEFLAETKLRAWSHFLPALVRHVQQEVLPAVIKRQQQQIDTLSIPSNLVRMYAVTRTEMIPQVLGDIYKDISDQFLPEIMQNNLDNALQQALPRVLENLYTRLQVESVPFFLQKQLASQQMRNVPRTLASLALKIDSVAFPYVLQEVYDRACLEAVPSILRTIKTEIIAQDIANNRVSADVAQRNVMENWRKQGAAPTNFDSWIDDTPTGKARTGFELLPSSSSLQLSVEAATLVLGSKATNKRFSIVDYDPQLAASYSLDQPTTTPEGFAIWKQVIAMDETAIAYVLQGVNNDVGRVSDFLTRDQLLFIRQYLINWAQSAITQRDRERFWRQSYAKRTTNTDINEPSVDIDIERISVQTGFNIQSGKASTSGINAAIAQQLWNSSSEFAFTNPQGFTKWQDAIGSSASASSVQDLLSGITGLTLAHVTEAVSWIQKLLQDGFINRRALRHWSDGTCTSVLRLPLSECLLYDLEPSIAGNQTGFEMNPSSDPTWQVTQAVRELLWDRTKPASFLVPTHPSNTDLGFGIWLQGIRSSNFARVVDKIKQPSLTEANSAAIASWLESWSMNELNVLNVYNWWRLSTCWPRRELSVTIPSSATSTMRSMCVESYREVESSSVITSTDSQSPYFTFEKTYHVTDDKCVWDATTKTYTRTSSTYGIKAQVFSCDTISTSLANDLDESTLGFELMPAATSASDRISLAAASALWNPSSPFSFLHEQGYKQWFTLGASDSASLLQVINAEIGTVCPALSGGGDRSGVFNETLAGVSCDVLSQSHFEDIQAWVRSQSSSEWIQNTLLDQWRRGIADELEIEPYRGGDQRGWELATGCSSSHCVLTEDSGLIYQIPRSTLSLWTLDHPATFLTSDGYSMWAALSNATRSADPIAIKAAKDDIIAACKQAKWEDWMHHAYEWLEVWKSNDHLFRDVLGHWMHAQCPTTPHLLSVIQRQPDAVTTTASCPPPEARYIVALKEAITGLQRAASRPVEFFRADIVETSAFVQPKKVVEVAETWIACEALDLTSFKQTVSSQTSLKEFQACNFLDVLANTALEELADAGSVFQPLSVTPVEATFEMNRSTPADISIEIAQQIWDQSTSFGFTNLSVFLEKWHPAMNNLDLLAAIHSDLIDTTHAAPATSDLAAVQEYLAMWESSAISTRGVGIAWLSQNISFAIDLDAHTDGVQGGFELHSSTGWRSLGGGKLPSFDQGQYLWRAANTFSFLHTNDGARNDSLPTGFNAWKEIHEGVDWSSEQLVDKYPLEAKVHINAAMQHSLSKDQCAALMREMENETQLTESQLQGIASWLMNWATSDVLRDYVLYHWATGETPRGEKDVSFNLAAHLERLFGFHSSQGVIPSDLFSADSPSLGRLTKTSRRNLWNVQSVGSFVNPNARVVWCTVVPNGDMIRFCPYLLNEFGVVSTSALTAFKAAVQSSAPQEVITKSSNLTKISISFLQIQLGIEESDAIHAIAMWWRRLPEASLFFQVNQLRTWRTSLASVSSDPLRFGYDLGFVFSVNQSVARNASRVDLVANPIVLDGKSSELGACNQSLELNLIFWDPSNAVSFLHPDGIKQWRQFFQYQLDVAEFLEFLTNSPDISAADTIASTGMTEADVSCTLQSIRNWLASWSQHPFLRQFVELLWFQSLESTSSLSLSSPLLSDANELLAAFPLDATHRDALSVVMDSDESLSRWANVSQILLDSSQSLAFINADEGFSTWKALLVNCFSSNETSGECQNSSSHALQDYQDHVSTANAAVALLVDSLWSQISNVAKQRAAESKTLDAMIRGRIVPWMISWLDHPLFERFVLQHVQEVEPSLDIKATSFHDLAMVQFVNASVTRKLHHAYCPRG